SSSPWKTNLMTNDRARWVASRVDAHSPDFTVHLGDVVHPVPHLPTYGAASGVANEIMSLIGSPLIYVPGNHDIGDKDNPTVPAYIVNQGYIEEFHRYYGPTYRSLDHKGVHLVMIDSPALNSGLSEEEEQRKWLEEDLEANKGRRTMVFSHYPPYLHKPGEPSNYDNIDMPARRWLLGLLEQYNVEAFFAGHVHHFAYRRHHGTQIYGLLSTCFVRQDFSELFRVEAADEHGRNDVAKLGYCIVDVYEAGHGVRVVRSYGETLAEGEEPGIRELVHEPLPFNRLRAPLGVHLRHGLTETADLPYMGPIDEFVRKRARNDYPVLALWEAGVRTVRLPLDDLRDDETSRRLHELHGAGHRYGFFSVNTPDPGLVAENRGIIDFLEVILPWEKAREALPRVSGLGESVGVPVYVANIESSVHRKRSGPKFSHYISHGFHVDDTAMLEEALPHRGGVDGFTFQVNQGESPLRSVERIQGYSKMNGFKAIANVWLASEDPAEFLADDDLVTDRAAESVVAAYAYPGVRVFLDTFVDHDRGYFPRVGLYDRRINPRKAGHVVRHLQAALNRYGPGIEVTGIDGPGTVTFKSPTAIYRLSLSPDEGVPRISGSRLIDLVTGEIDPKEPETGNPGLEVKQRRLE
ncbi:metallophosphoesterase, partial [Candidatus Bathyarchaeota archaeon]|nr:metallophosphoesterase [Candidatus Bathyarchaeota archaeon]